MSHTPHELDAEFPRQVDALHRLKASDAHFAKVCDDYHIVNRAIHRAETDIQPTDDLHLVQMRKERLALKDMISAALREAADQSS